MPLEPGLGSSQQGSETEQILTDMAAGMGSAIAQEQGSLAWIEALVRARLFNSMLNFGRLLAAQLEPVDATVYLNRWQEMLLTFLPEPQLDFYIAWNEKQTNTPPTLNNVDSFLTSLLGTQFLGIVWNFEAQAIRATRSPTDAHTKGWQSPLSAMLMYEWQKRDNQDHLLVSDNMFNQTVDSYLPYVQNWIPAGTELITYVLINRGFQDGYANDYNGLNFNNYLDGYNVVSGTAGSPNLVGTGTAFKTYPDASPGDFIQSVNEGYQPPIQIVDDNNQLQTYFVKSVTDNTHLVLTSNLVNNITNRTYRTLGFLLDTNGVLDNGSLFNE